MFTHELFVRQVFVMVIHLTYNANVHTVPAPPLSAISIVLSLVFDGCFI